MSSKADLLHKLEWDPLFVASNEALKMIRENFVTKSVVSREIKKFSEDLKNGSATVLPSVDRYKLNLINEAHESIKDGIFSMQDIENFQTYYKRDDMTIFATPRVLNAETEMAWAIVCPLIDRLEGWKKVEELYLAGVLKQNEFDEAKASLLSGEAFGLSVGKSIFFLSRMKYAKNRGIIDEKGYQKAIKLIPLMKKEILGEVEAPLSEMNSEEILEGIEGGEQAAMREEIVAEEFAQIDGYQEQSDPVFEWKRLVFILADAWQATLNIDLRGLFEFLQTGQDIEVLQQVHKFLVHLNREYVADGTEDEAKQTIYHKKIEKFLASLTVRQTVG